MPKFYGVIGYAVPIESEPGIWIEDIEERSYFGNLIRNNRRLQNSGNVNDNIDISNEISIIADPYAIRNFHQMRYVTLMDAKWKIKNVEVRYPRLILSVGGLYNENENGTTQFP